MNKAANLSTGELRELFLATLGKRGGTEPLIEKDFWVSFVLKELFEDDILSQYLLFKGGTSLSKCYNLIKRFSEDIDLILDWRVLGITDDEAWEDRSGNQQEKFNKLLDKKGAEFISKNILPALQAKIKSNVDGKLSAGIGEDPNSIHITYPKLFEYEYINPEIKLEIGPRAARIPSEEIRIRSFVAEEYPDQFANPDFKVKVITPERTFWEKITILHQVASSGQEKPVALRHSRHYYDVFMISRNKKLKESAMKEIYLLEDVARFKEKFYPSASAKYKLAKPGTLKILPHESKLQKLRGDYQSMQEMMFEAPPSFEEIIDGLEIIEKEIHGSK